MVWGVKVTRLRLQSANDSSLSPYTVMESRSELFSPKEIQSNWRNRHAHKQSRSYLTPVNLSCFLFIISSLSDLFWFSHVTINKKTQTHRFCQCLTNNIKDKS